MLTSKVVDQFLVLHQTTGEVLLQTPLLAYFVRATSDEADQNDGVLQYLVKCHDGELINITGQFFNYHPMLEEELDSDLRSIVVVIPGGALIDLHPDHRPDGDHWVFDELQRRDFDGDQLNDLIGIDFNRPPSLNHDQ